MKSRYKLLLGLLACSTLTQTYAQLDRKAIVNDSVDSIGWHQGGNYNAFLDRAPEGWSCFLSGSGGVKNGFNYSGMNWSPWSGADMIQSAVANGFSIVMHYGTADIDQDVVDAAARNGCAVFTFLEGPNLRHYTDYRIYTPAAYGLGPMPAMSVAGGFPASAGSENAYGPQCEFIDAVWAGGLRDGTPLFDAAQSWAHSATAARYAKLKDLHPTWNVFDLRQALRQSCTFYAAGWREDGGYGFPKVLNRVGDDFTEASLPQNLSDLDAGPPIQAYAQVTSDGTQVVFHWYNFRQTGFSSTVIKVNGQTIFDGDATSFNWTPTISGLCTAEFFTKLTDNRLSRSEIYTKFVLRGLATTSPSTAIVSSGQLIGNQFLFTVSGPNGTYCNVFKSDDLNQWTQIGGVTLTSGPVTVTNDVLNVDHRFYKLVTAGFCSRVIGFEKEPIAPGYNLIANQLDAVPDDTLASVFAQTILPQNSTVYKWHGSGYSGSTWDGASWSDSTMVLTPGESALIYNPGSSFVATFIGLVREGELTVPLVNGYNFVSSIVPQSGGIQSVLGCNLESGDTVIRKTADGDKYYTYLGDDYLADFPTGWVDGDFVSVDEPVINVGEGFEIMDCSGHSETWTRNFDACSGSLLWAQPTFRDGVASIIGSPNDMFGFSISGPVGSRWNVYKSYDLVNWTLMGPLTIGADGSYWYEDDYLGNAGQAFYRVSNGYACSKAFGYEKETVFNGYNLLANQLDASIENSLAASALSDVISGLPGSNLRLVFSQTEFFSYLPSNFSVYKWHGSGYSGSTWDGASWSDPTMVMAPGESVLVYNPGSPFVVAFIGQVREGQLSVPLVNGYNFVSSLVPQSGGIQSVLGCNLESGDVVIRKTAGGDIYYVYLGSDYLDDFPTGWADGIDLNPTDEPIINVGEGFEIMDCSGHSETWTRGFSLSCP